MLPVRALAPGLEQCIGEVLDLAALALHLDHAANISQQFTALLPKGVLLCGGVGSGKTLVLELVSAELQRRGAAVIRINGPELLASFASLGSRQSASPILTHALKLAQQHEAAVIVLDDLDAIMPEQSSLSGDTITNASDSSERAQAATALLTFLDNLSSIQSNNKESQSQSYAAALAPRVAVLGATCRTKTSVMPALFGRGRFDNCITLPMPSEADRAIILETALLRAHNTGTSDQREQYKAWSNIVAQSTAGFTGGDLMRLFNTASTHASTRHQDTVQQSNTNISAAADVGTVSLHELLYGVVADEPNTITSQIEPALALQPELVLLVKQDNIVYDDIVYALALAAPLELQGIDTTIQSTSSGWDAIGGYIHVKKRLIQLIQWPWEHPEQFEVHKSNYNDQYILSHALSYLRLPYGIIVDMLLCTLIITI
jgi:SpoVK/Ycf46/Vps4 family AAA+-type ATPase